MIKKYEQIISDIHSRNFNPIYLLTGSETYYIDELASKFENSVLEQNEKDFNFTLLYGRDTNIEEIVSNSKQYPVMSDYRLVIVREAQDIDKREWNKIEKYLESPVPSTILIICFKYKTFEKALLKKLDKRGVIFESKKLYDNAIPNWVNNYCKSIHFQIEPKASQLVADYLGNDLEKIANEISKLSINLKNGDVITTQCIGEHIGISKEYNVFELQNALASKDVLKSNKIINYFEANPKENPFVMIISSLFSFFVKVLIASQVTEKTETNIAQAIGVNPYFAKDYIKAINMYPQGKLYYIISLLREYDMKSKGVDISPYTTDGELLKELIYKILH